MQSVYSTLNRAPALSYGLGKKSKSTVTKTYKVGNSRRARAAQSYYSPNQRAAQLSSRNVGSVQMLPLQSLRAQPRKIAVRYYSTGKTVDVPLTLGIDSVSSGLVSSINYEVGDFVEMDEAVVTFETDKVEVEAKAPFSGVIKAINVNMDDEVEENTVVFTIEEAEGEAPAKKEEKTETPKKEESPKKEEAQKQAESSKKAETPKKAETKKPAPQTSAPSQTTNTSERAVTREKMKPIRVRIAERLKDSQNTAAMLTTFQEIDMHNLIEMRKTFKDEFQETHGVKLGFMSAFVKASSIALKKHPLVNSVIDTETNEIIHRNYHDISVAVSTPKGLVVPVVRGVENMGFATIEKTINDLAVAARDNKLSMEDMSGGTFTISNGGVYGSLFGTPIINPPQSAILGMHATTKRATVVGDEIKIRPVMFVALTYDHRLIDGRDAVLFLKTIKHCIEEPNRILLDI
eukprot:TRINITY_DN10330_c0_g1_i1.p1 TRINITY_DN10330_c0_g1~~TRINITY_DN10330_c0_g1_i1.p1  ORF type:complete len:461 (+),score=129.09 TRINITY_DN10330_c0_g1_i1:18-1400(+)